jgi:hypothetical protein
MVCRQIDVDCGTNVCVLLLLMAAMVLCVCQVIGLEKNDSHHSVDIRRMVEEHLLGIRQHTVYKTAVIILIVESNSSWLTSDYLARLCQQAQFQPVVIESVDPKNLDRPGIITTKESKEINAAFVAELLENDKIHIAEDLVATNPNADLAELFTQLYRFRREFKESKDIHGERKETLTGKIALGGRQGFAKDDLCMALQICAKSIDRIQRDQSYRKMARKSGFIL